MCLFNLQELIRVSLQSCAVLNYFLIPESSPYLFINLSICACVLFLISIIPSYSCRHQSGWDRYSREGEGEGEGAGETAEEHHWVSIGI